MSNTILNLCKLRAMNLVFRLAGDMRSTHFPAEERENAALALEEFRQLSDKLFSYADDAALTPDLEGIVHTIDAFEAAVDTTQAKMVSRELWLSILDEHMAANSKLS